MNGVKTAALMAILTMILVLIGGAIAGKAGVLIMLLISLGINFFSYWFSDSIVLKTYGATPITREESPNLYGLVEDLTRRANLPMPKVCIIESDVPNAFATGRNPSHAAVAVTTGIMQALSYEELAGVLGHELSHVQHRDTLISTVAGSIAGVISTLATIAQWSAIFGGRDRENSNPIALIAVAIIAPIAASIIQMTISRTREYSADKRGGEICGNPLYLARALEKIDYYAKHGQPMAGASNTTAHLFIINPLSGSKSFSSLFSTHPNTADRIARLKEQAAAMHIKS